VDDEVRFAADLYRGTAGCYDRYRLPYPEPMIEDLARAARVSGRGPLPRDRELLLRASPEAPLSCRGLTHSMERAGLGSGSP
jgi:hypothetical protein